MLTLVNATIEKNSIADKIIYLLLFICLATISYNFLLKTLQDFAGNQHDYQGGSSQAKGSCLSLVGLLGVNIIVQLEVWHLSVNLQDKKGLFNFCIFRVHLESKFVPIAKLRNISRRPTKLKLLLNQWGVGTATRRLFVSTF